MVDYAVQIIFLHVTWLFKRFSKEDAQDATKVDLLCTRRDTALQTFSPLFLGETTNTANAVRRQAFISFINTHVLFAKRAEGRGGAPASDVCSVAVPDEIQHRLGGAFQAAIERYASVMETRSAGQEESQQRESYYSSKHMTIILIQSAARELTPDKIQEDLHFFQLVSVFVGAIRCGVLEVEHAKEPLAHYSRFGPTYDSIVKKLVDVLRDEGIYNREADAVQHVAGSALQQSFNIFLDSEEDEPTAPLALARVIATAFVIHGSQFAILRQLHPSDVCDFHLEALDFVSRKFSTTVKQEGNARNKEQKSRLTRKKWAVLTFFKVLVPLLGPVTGKDALKIKAHLEDVIDSSGVQLTTNKGWDGYRAYEKRLIGIASKDPNVKMMASKKVVERENTEG